MYVSVPGDIRTSKTDVRHAEARRAARPIVKRFHGVLRTRPRNFRCAAMELLTEQRVLRNKRGPPANDADDQPNHEPNEVHHTVRGSGTRAGSHL
jgi:hypothetical protein